MLLCRGSRGLLAISYLKRNGGKNTKKSFPSLYSLGDDVDKDTGRLFLVLNSVTLLSWKMCVEFRKSSRGEYKERWVCVCGGGG